MRKTAANLGQNDGIDTAGAAVPAETPATAAGDGAKEKPVFNQFAYQNEYVRAKYDRINLTMPKGQKAVVKKRAADRGQSVNEYINALIAADLDAGAGGIIWQKGRQGHRRR